MASLVCFCCFSGTGTETQLRGLDIFDADQNVAVLGA